MKILIAYEHRRSPGPVETWLKDSGWTVTKAADGEEAWTIIRQGGLELVLSDILLPGLDGFELCRRVKGDPELARLPFVFVTSTFTDPEDQESARRNGADGFIRLPAEASDFLERLAGILKFPPTAAAPSAGAAPPEDEQPPKPYNPGLIRRMEEKINRLQEEVRLKGRALETAEQSAGKFRQVLDKAAAVIFVLQQGRVIFGNARLGRSIGFASDEIIGRPFLELIHPDDRDDMEIMLARWEDTGDLPRIAWYRILSRHGTDYWIEAKLASVDWEGRLAVLVFAYDVTERKKAENGVKAALEEKEILLKEIHHRVKNNMQVISSLLNLQANNIQDEEVLSLFRESQDRIRAMALIHETLYQSGSLAHIELNYYIPRLAKALVRAYGSSRTDVALTTDLGGVVVNIDLAVPCGLVINELISNSLKYAFLGRNTGEIAIRGEIREDDWVRLVISDDGNGMPPGMDWRGQNTLGLSLVKALVENQLKGVIEMDQDSGTRFEIRFQASEFKQA